MSSRDRKRGGGGRGGERGRGRGRGRGGKDQGQRKSGKDEERKRPRQEDEDEIATDEDLDGLQASGFRKVDKEFFEKFLAKKSKSTKKTQADKGWKPVPLSSALLAEAAGEFIGLDVMEGGSIKVLDLDSASSVLAQREPADDEAKRPAKKVRHQKADIPEKTASQVLPRSGSLVLKRPAKVSQKIKKPIIQEEEIEDEVEDEEEKAEKEAEKNEEDDECDITFKAFLSDAVLQGVKEMGFKRATPIQQYCLPSAIRDRKDIVAAAQTGSGKTSAFGLPLLEVLSKHAAETGRLERKKTHPEEFRLQALILVPTRELAIQVSEHISAVGKHTGLTLLTITGGLAEERQKRLLNRAPEIVVATPGRLWALISSGTPYLADLSQLAFLILDEADRMVEPGHFGEIHHIIGRVNGMAPSSRALASSSSQTLRRQTFLFSATLSSADRAIGKLRELITFLGTVAEIDLTRSQLLAERLQEASISCSKEDKDIYLVYCLWSFPAGRSVVFVNSIDCLRRIYSLLQLLRFAHAYPLHSDLQQRQRLKNLDRFRSTSDGILIATDVASRGLDIPSVNYIFHYQVPRSAELYVHRSGRTARAEESGLSIEMISPDERALYTKSHRAIGRDHGIPSLPIDTRIFSLVRKRVSVGRQLEKAEHITLKRSVHNSWLQKQADEADIEVDEDQFYQEDPREQARGERDKQRLRVELDQLLKQKLDFGTGIHSLKYPTLCNDATLVSNLVKVRTKINLPK
ncbi:MAG: DEAD/DEAH box helicase [archaeon]|nr:DEAD/DEAH box helicase [archaeon]